MIDYYMPIHIEYRNGLKIVVDVADEYLSTSTTDKWFITRVLVYVDKYVLGTAFRGQCSYNEYTDVLTNGVAESLVESAIAQAKAKVPGLINKLKAVQ
jgi:hypothetical protein